MMLALLHVCTHIILKFRTHDVQELQINAPWFMIVWGKCLVCESFWHECRICVRFWSKSPWLLWFHSLKASIASGYATFTLYQCNIYMNPLYSAEGLNSSSMLHFIHADSDLLVAPLKEPLANSIAGESQFDLTCFPCFWIPFHSFAHGRFHVCVKRNEKKNKETRRDTYKRLCLQGKAYYNPI